MSELGTLARPYAKAAFEYASDAGVLQKWHDMLHTVATVVGEEKVANLLDSPNYTVSQQVEKIAEVLGDAIDEPMRNFLAALARNRRLGMLPRVLDIFQAMKAAHERSIDVEVIAVEELTAEQQQTLVRALSRRLEREVSLITSIDSSLIGGLVIRAGDTVFDGSVKGRLAKLAEALNS